jgi:ribonucleoside-diphosphate reductase alpha chain
MTTERRRLPNRRASETFAIKSAGTSYIATVSRFENGQIAEVFLSNHRAGSQADSNARDSAVVCSIALQFGAPLDVIRRALLRDLQGRPSSALGVVLDMIAGGQQP